MTVISLKEPQGKQAIATTQRLLLVLALAVCEWKMSNMRLCAEPQSLYCIHMRWNEIRVCVVWQVSAVTTAVCTLLIRGSICLAPLQPRAHSASRLGTAAGRLRAAIRWLYGVAVQGGYTAQPSRVGTYPPSALLAIAGNDARTERCQARR